MASIQIREAFIKRYLCSRGVVGLHYVREWLVLGLDALEVVVKDEDGQVRVCLLL